MPWLPRRPIFRPIRSRLIVTGLSVITCDVTRSPGLGISGDTKIRNIYQLGSQPADHRGGVAFRKGVSLHNDGRSGLAIATRRGRR
jgi:hypothetical protein